MKKYLIEMLFYFLFPATLIAVVSEYSLRKIPNDYAFKSQWLTQNSHDVELLALGASTVVYGINPQFLQHKGFNAAHVSQSLKYDHFIFNEFIDQMPSLEYLVMGIDYDTPFLNMEETHEWWRIKFYNIYYGGKFYRFESKYNYELYFHNIGTFKRAANGFLTLLGLENETRRTVNDVGYGADYTMDKRSIEWDNGGLEAFTYNRLISEAIQGDPVEQNRQYLEEIIRKSADKNVKVILMSMPLYKSYRDNRQKEFVDQQIDFCNYFAQKYKNVLFYDFSADSRFSADDFYDPNHLNEKGAEKFTRMIDSIIVHQSPLLFTESEIKQIK